jgi:hypothetical protein
MKSTPWARSICCSRSLQLLKVPFSWARITLKNQLRITRIYAPQTFNFKLIGALYCPNIKKIDYWGLYCPNIKKIDYLALSCDLQTTSQSLKVLYRNSSWIMGMFTVWDRVCIWYQSICFKGSTNLTVSSSDFLKR